jgi:8-oxo-dGTP pyrophosphatase MutT (NUDIX family)
VYEFEPGLRERIRARLEEFEPAAADPDPSLRRAAVNIVLVADTATSTADDGRSPSAAFLITGRSAHLRSHARQWALPGGRLDEGESAGDAARREVAEEVGLRIDADDVLGRLDDFTTRSGYLITPMVAWCADANGLDPNPEEVDTVERIPLADLDHPGSPRFLRIAESDEPVIQLYVGGHWIHAPTAAVLYQFREVALHGHAIRVAHLEQPVWAWR